MQYLSIIFFVVVITFANIAGNVPPNGEIASGSTNALYILTEAYGLIRNSLNNYSQIYFWNFF